MKLEWFNISAFGEASSSLVFIKLANQSSSFAVIDVAYSPATGTVYEYEDDRLLLAWFSKVTALLMFHN